MKKLFCLILAMTMLIGLVSCQNGNGDTETTYMQPPENSPYEFKREGDKTYILLKNDYSQHKVQLANVSFKSFEQFVETVFEYKMTDSKLAIVEQSFPRDSEGNIPICDLYDYYIPILPVGFNISSFIWTGELYGYDFSNESAFGIINFETEDMYKSEFDKGYVNRLNNDNFTITKEETLEEKNATVYYYTTPSSDIKLIKYETEKEGMKYSVLEMYVLRTNSELGTASDVIPKQVKAFIEGKGVFCTLQLYPQKEIDTNIVFDFTWELYKDNAIKQP